MRKNICPYCGARVRDTRPLPSNHMEWRREQTLHSKNCEWARTRGFTLLLDSQLEELWKLNVSQRMEVIQ